MATAASPYLRHRFPPEIITQCVLLYMRFPLSFRAVEEAMLLRGVQVSYETIRRWCQQFAHELRRRRPKPGDKWHLDEVFLKINGQTYYLWRAVDQEGNVLDVLVQSRRNAAAAKRLMRKLMKKLQCVPRVLITDKLPSYGVAHRELMRERGASQEYVPEQPGGELAPTDAAERTSDATLQVARISPTFSLRLQPDLTTLPTPAASPGSSSLPAGDASTSPHVAGGDPDGGCGVNGGEQKSHLPAGTGGTTALHLYVCGSTTVWTRFLRKSGPGRAQATSLGVSVTV